MQTNIIETPVGKNKIEIKDWITGRQREYINEPMFSSVKTQPEMVAGKPTVKFGDFNVEKYIKDSAHREIETFVVSIDGQKEFDIDGKKISLLDYILDTMHEDDYEFIKEKISEIAKKKEMPNI